MISHRLILPLLIAPAIAAAAPPTTAATRNTRRCDRLAALIGETRDGNAVKAFIDDLGVPPKASHVEEHTYYHWKPYGFTLRFDNDALSTVYFYSLGVDGAQEYNGGLPEGLEFTMTPADVRRRLGDPEAAGDDWAWYKSKGLQVHYRILGPEDKATSIRYITISAAEK